MQIFANSSSSSASTTQPSTFHRTTFNQQTFVFAKKNSIENLINSHYVLKFSPFSKKPYSLTNEMAPRGENMKKLQRYSKKRNILNSLFFDALIDWSIILCALTSRESSLVLHTKKETQRAHVVNWKIFFPIRLIACRTVKSVKFVISFKARNRQINCKVKLIVELLTVDYKLLDEMAEWMVYWIEERIRIETLRSETREIVFVRKRIEGKR